MPFQFSMATKNMFFAIYEPNTKMTKNAFFLMLSQTRLLLPTTVLLSGSTWGRRAPSCQQVL